MAAPNSALRSISRSRSTEFGAAIAQLPGYLAKDAGVVKGVNEALR